LAIDRIRYGNHNVRVVVALRGNLPSTSWRRDAPIESVRGLFQLGCCVMERGIGGRLSGLTSETGEATLRMSGALVKLNRVTSELYFVKSRKHQIDTTDTRTFTTREVTLIYLSFTGLRISIVLPGRSVSLEGGKVRAR
jgi:hypothetical protein